ncbi:MAG: FAD-dependent oxidoreductase, partial [Bacteroidia bacterium]|nr:FAD-dependent oxidoreductase [Bacteroidia bacterium]
MFDLGIIGGGPGGYVAAERAAAGGLNVVLFEKKSLGGVCLNEGCIPTKTMLYSAKLYDNARHSEKYGVNVENASIDYRIILKRKEKVVKKLVGAVKVSMRDNGVTVVNADAFIEGRDTENGVIRIAAGGESYEVGNLLICTGSEAFVPPIPGLAEAGDIICTNREILMLTEAPQELVVIGGGVIGMEFASFFNSIGTKVTVVEMLPKILGNLDGEVSARLQTIYTKKGVTFNLGCKVVAVEGNTVVFQDPQGETQRVSGDKILVSVGRRANIKGFGLENIGVETERGIKVDDHMRTNVPNVYAAGDVTGFSLLAHTASREGEVAVNNILGKDDRMSYDAIPGVVYTNPEVAGVGLTE